MILTELHFKDRTLSNLQILSSMVELSNLEKQSYSFKKQFQEWDEKLSKIKKENEFNKRKFSIVRNKLIFS